MKYLKITGIIFLILIAGLIVFIIYTPGKEIKFDPGPEFEYTGLTNIKNEQYDKVREYIPLRDGTKLAITTLIPNNREEKEFPVILTFIPYSGSKVIPEMPWSERLASKYYIGKWGPVYEDFGPNSYTTLNTFISNGYVMAVVDMRGTGSSTGFVEPLDEQIISDAEEILAWVADQPWSNKKTGMMGLSYEAWAQFAAASTKSPYLKCIAPEVTFFNLYTEGVRPGGILAERWKTEYTELMKSFNRNLWNTKLMFPSFPSEPVIDEDGDGKLYDEVPILTKNDLHPYDAKPNYADGNERKESAYMALTREHEKNIWPDEHAINYIDDSVVSYGREKAFSNRSVDMMIKNLKETKIPVLLLGGFFDGFSKGTLQSFASLRDTNPAYLFMTQRCHVGLSYEYAKWLGLKYRSSHQLISTQLQFFDKYLKGLDNGFDVNPPVKIYTAFEGWKYYDSWPPEAAESIAYRIGLDNSLTNKNPEDTVYAYDVDFTHSSSYYSKAYNPMMMGMMNDSIMVRNEHDKKCLVFETEVLKTPITIMGSPIVSLNLSSNQPNADIYVYLSDVDTAGVVHYVSEGKLRAGWHKLFDNDLMVNGLYDVKPELPWHSFRKEDYDPIPFANDSIINLKFDLKPQAWKFRPGHKIRLSIAGADYKNYEFNPAISPDNTLENCKPTTLYIHASQKYQSSLELPIIK